MKRRNFMTGIAAVAASISIPLKETQALVVPGGEAFNLAWTKDYIYRTGNISLYQIAEEPNSWEARKSVLWYVRPNMEYLKCIGAIKEYILCCDAFNNLKDDLDEVHLNLDLYVRHNDQENYTHYEWQHTRTGIKFNEIDINKS